MQGSSRRLSTEDRKAAFQSFRQSQRRMSQKAMSVETDSAEGANGATPADQLEGQSFRSSDTDRGMVLPFDPVVMTFRDVHYWVNCPPVGSTPLLGVE